MSVGWAGRQIIKPACVGELFILSGTGDAKDVSVGEGVGLVVEVNVAV